MTASAARSPTPAVLPGALHTLPVVDFVLPGPLPVAFIRVYRSAASDRAVGIGFGWSHPYAWRAEERRAEIRVIDADGAETTFPRLAEAESAAAPFGRRLTRYGGDLVLTTPDGLRRVLRRAGGSLYLLSEVRDRAGNRVEIGWDNGEVAWIVDSVGRRAERRREGARKIWSAVAKDAAGRAGRRELVAYELDARGDLVRVVDPEGTATAFAYDEHLLVEERRPDDVIFRFVYEAAGAPAKRKCLETWGELDGRDLVAELAGEAPRKSRQREPRGVFHARFEYGPFPGETTVVDAVGAVHRYTGNALGLVTKYVDPRGGVSTLDYDDHGNILAAIDANRSVEQRSYDGDGRIDTRDLLLTRVDPGGASTHFTYDERGLTTSITGPNGATDTMAYDGHGNLAVYRDSRLGPTSLAGERNIQLYTHGAPGQLQLGNRMVSGKQMGEFLSSKGFSGDSIKVNACNGGTRPYFGLGQSAAQQLANETGCDVKAPTATWGRTQEGALLSTDSAGNQEVRGGSYNPKTKTWTKGHTFGRGWSTVGPRF